jgi:signal transduction histidine kinase
MGADRGGLGQSRGGTGAGALGAGGVAAGERLRARLPVHPRVILGLAIAIVAVLLGVFALVLAQSQATSRHESEQRFLAQATIAAGLTKAIFSTIDAPQVTAASKSEGTATVNRRTLTALVRGSGLSYAYVVGSAGRVLAATPGAPPLGPTTSAVVRRALAGSTLFSDLLRDSAGRYLIVEAIPFPTRFGRRVEVLGYPAALLSGFLSSYLVGALPDKTSHGFILDGHGRIIASSVSGVAVGQRPSAQFSAILASAPAGAAVQGRYDVSTGRSRGTRYVVAAPIGGSDWRVGLTEPTNTLYPADVGSQWWVIWLVFVGFALAALACLWLLRRSLSGAARLVAQARVVDATNAELNATNAELNAFSYSVSHDLRAPLRAIDGFSRIVLEDDDGTLTQAQERYLGLVRDNTKVMGTLIDDLLAFSRLANQPLTRTLVDTGHLAQAIQDELRAAHPGRAIEFRNGDLPAVRADPALLRQVLANLLANAVKYSSERDRSEITLDSELRGGERVFFVRDNGVGFDMRYVEKVFQVFQRLHRAEDYSGTGVGLAIVQRIITRHGGRVWAEGHPGEGATFYFTLGEGSS